MRLIRGFFPASKKRQLFTKRSIFYLTKTIVTDIALVCSDQELVFFSAIIVLYSPT